MYLCVCVSVLLLEGRALEIDLIWWCLGKGEGKGVQAHGKREGTGKRRRTRVEVEGETRQHSGGAPLVGAKTTREAGVPTEV